MQASVQRALDLSVQYVYGSIIIYARVCMCICMDMLYMHGYEYVCILYPETWSFFCP